MTRPLCPYPDPDATYAGGDPTQASSYACDDETVSYDDPATPGPGGAGLATNPATGTTAAPPPALAGSPYAAGLLVAGLAGAGLVVRRRRRLRQRG